MAKSAAVQYEVRYRITGTTQWGDIKTFAPTGEIAVNGLDRNQQYDFQVRAVSACGARSAWVASAQTVPSSATPAAVATLNATSLADGVHLDWSSAATQPAGVEYSLERSPDNATWAERVRLRGTAYTDPETSGTTYFYRVRAINFMGVAGGYSPVASNKGFSVSTLAAEVTSAQSGADAANAQLANIASDGILSPAEKPVVERDYAVILAEQGGIDGQAVNFLGAGSAQQQGYDNAITALTNYLATLSSPVSWSDKTGNTNINGPTFRSNFNNVYTARQTLLNAIYAKAQNLANGAQSSANTANSTANSAAPASVVNPNFSQGLSGWNPDVGNGGWYPEVGGSSPNPQLNTYAVHAGSAISGGNPGGIATIALRNTAFVPVSTGQIITVAAQIRGVGGPDGYANARVSWRDANQNEISVSQGNNISGNTTNTSRVSASAPANAVYAHAEVACYNHHIGYYTVTAVSWSYSPNSQDEVPDGSTYGRTSNTRLAPGNRPFIDFAETYHANKNIDNMSDGGTYGRVRNGQLNNGVVWSFGNGRNCVFNPTFSQNSTGISNLQQILGGGMLADGWFAGGSNGGTLQAFPYNGTLYSRMTNSMAVNASTVNGGVTYGANIYSQKFSVNPGAPYKFNVARNFDSSGALPPGVTAYHRVFIDFQDYAGNHISYDNIQDINLASAPNATNNYSGTIPANASTATINCYILLTNSGPATALANGSYYSAILRFVEFMQASHMDNDVIDGSTYARTLGARLSGGKPWIDFGEGIHANKNLDNIGEGSTYGRVAQTAIMTGTGVPFSGAYSANCVSNPSFSHNRTNTPLNTQLSGGTYVSESWKYDQWAGSGITASSYAVTLGNGNILSGINDATIATQWNSTIPAGYSNGFIHDQNLTPVNGRDTLVFGCQYQSGGMNLPSGSSQVFIGFDYLNASYGYIGGSYTQPNASAGGSGYLSWRATPPAGTAWVRCVMGVQLNNTGAAFNPGNNTYAWVRTTNWRLQLVAQSQADLPQRTVTNIAAKVPASISFNAASGSPATATINVGAMTVLAGSVTTSYNAATANVSGTGGATVTYFLYYNDPNYVGGAQTLVATTNGNDIYAGDGYVYVGQVSVTFPTSGSGSGGGSSGGGGSCVGADMLVAPGQTAAAPVDGFLFDCMDIPTSGLEKFKRPLLGQEISVEERVLLITSGGAELECSVFTPFDLIDGGMQWSPAMKGHRVVTDRGIEEVVEVRFIGPGPVCHRHHGGCSYAAGRDASHRIYSHNTIAKP